MVPQTWTPDGLLADLAAFEQLLLTECGVALKRGSSIDRGVRDLLDLISALSGEEVVLRDRRRQCLAGVGLADLVIKTCAVAQHPEFPKFCSHFRELLKEGGLLQNTRTLYNEDATNKIFELLMALSLLQVGTDLDLEHPQANPGPGNPDVLIDLDGMRWSLACKVLNARNIKTYFDRVDDGIRQIEKASTASRGFVVVNLKNVLHYDALWPPPIAGLRDGAWPSIEDLGALVEQQVEQFLQDFEQAFGGDAHIQKLFDAKRAAPVVLNYVNVTAPCVLNGRSILTNLRMIVPLELGTLDGNTRAALMAVDRCVATP